MLYIVIKPNFIFNWTFVGRHMLVETTYTVLYMYPRSCIYRGLHWFSLVPRLLPNSEHPLLQEIWIWTVHVSLFFNFLVQYRVWRPVTYSTHSPKLSFPLEKLLCKNDFLREEVDYKCISAFSYFKSDFVWWRKMLSLLYS